ncbi:MAG: hypothetical protein N4A59_16395 [Marinifilum sp.]|jgi:hypothetical protein|nr:hypothetical protein [Marinifilum sp.]
MDVIDSIKYFAQFAPKDAVLKNFERMEGYNDIPGYEELRAYVKELPDHPKMPELKGFVLAGHEEDNLKDHIKSLNGYFLMIEYGILQGSRPDKVGVRDFSFAETIFLVHHGNKKGFDIIQESLIMDECERLSRKLLQQMEADDKEELCGNTKFLQSALSLVPVDSSRMHGAIGWGLTISKNTVLF